MTKKRKGKSNMSYNNLKVEIISLYFIHSVEESLSYIKQKKNNFYKLTALVITINYYYCPNEILK